MFMSRKPIPLADVPRVTYRYGRSRSTPEHCTGGHLNQNDPDGMPIYVSDGCQPRASKLFRRVRKALSKHGYEIRETGEGWRRGVRIVKDGWKSEMKLREVTRMQRVTGDRWGTKVVYIPTGVLAFRVGDYIRKEMRDTKRKSLEDRVPKIVDEVRVAHARHIEQVVEAEERRAREHERAKAQAEEANRIKEREERFQLLANEAGQWQRSNLIRDYVAEVERVLRAEDGQELQEVAREWLAWARSEADRTDPIVILGHRIERYRSERAAEAAT